MTIRPSLFSVLLDDSVDMERTENRGRTIIVKNRDMVPSRMDLGVIYRRHGIFMPLGCADDKGSEGNAIEAFANVSNHVPNFTPKNSRPP